MIGEHWILAQIVISLLITFLMQKIVALGFLYKINEMRLCCKTD